MGRERPARAGIVVHHEDPKLWIWDHPAPETPVKDVVGAPHRNRGSMESDTHFEVVLEHTDKIHRTVAARGANHEFDRVSVRIVNQLGVCTERVNLISTRQEL